MPQLIGLIAIILLISAINIYGIQPVYDVITLLYENAVSFLTTPRL